MFEKLGQLGLDKRAGWLGLSDENRAVLATCGIMSLSAAVMGVAFGSLSVQHGATLLQATAMSTLVFAGGAQLVAVAVLAAGGGGIAAVASGLLVNSRYLGYGVALRRLLSRRSEVMASHLMIDASLAFAHLPLRQARWAYYALGAAAFVCFNAGTLLGAAVLGDFDARGVGLDAAFPVCMLALLKPQLGARPQRLAAGLGGLLAVAGALALPAGLPVLVASLAAPFAARFGGRP